jgi:HAE1 family hydrophobic/amphiphilic exporter-1
MPEGSALAVTDGVLDRLAQTVASDPRVKVVYTSAGQTDLTAFAGSAREANRGQVTVVLKNTSDHKGEEQVAAHLREAMDQMPGLAYEFERPSLLTFKSPVEVEIYTYDLDSLRVLAQAVAHRIEGVRGVEDVQSSMRLGDPRSRSPSTATGWRRWTWTPRRHRGWCAAPCRARRRPSSAIWTGSSTCGCAPPSRSARSWPSWPTWTWAAAGDSRWLWAPSPTCASRAGPAEIRRISQQRAAVVSANLKGRDLASAARDIQAVLDGMQVPPGSKVALAGQNRELGESFGSLRFAILLAVFLVYLVMASQFESLLHPFVIMFTLPMALVGVVATLLVTGTT